MINFDLAAVIPARLGSSRVTRKVFQTVDGEDSLLSRKIKQLRRILPAEKVIVNTESDEIAEEALTSGASVHWRDPYFSDGHKASFSAVIDHVISSIDSEHIAWTPFVTPFFNSDEFSASFANYEKYVIAGDYDSLVSVVPIKNYLWDKNGPLNYQANRNHTISQELPDWYQVSNGNYMAPKRVMQLHKYVLGVNVFLDTRSQCCSIDIDTVEDLKIARALCTIYS